MSSEGVAHRPRPSIPSPQERVQNRTVERNFVVPMVQIHVPSAAWSKSLLFSVGAGGTVRIFSSSSCKVQLAQRVFRNLKAVAHMLVEDQATRRLSQEVFCSTALAMLASPTTLNVRWRIDPLNLGFTQATLLSTTHHLRHLSCQRDRQVRCEGQQKTVHVAWALAFSKDARERCMGTFVDSPQCGGGGDDIGSGVSTDDDTSLQICDEPRPGAVFRGLLFLSVSESRSAPHDQRRVASAHRSSTLVISFS